MRLPRISWTMAASVAVGVMIATLGPAAVAWTVAKLRERLS
jgi:hypothetical protein